MITRFCSRIVPSITTLVLVLLAAARVPAEVMVADSIETRVTHADAIVRASVTTVDVEDGANGLFIEKATLKVVETLKGQAPERLHHPVRLYRAGGWEVFDRPSRWKEADVELLAFVNDGKVKSVLRLDGKKSHGQGYRAFTLDMQVCKTRNSIFTAVYSALAFDEQQKPAQTIPIDVPIGVEFWPEVYGGSSVLLNVPLDSRLETAATRWAKTDRSSLHGASMKEQAQHILKEMEKAKSAK